MPRTVFLLCLLLAGCRSRVAGTVRLHVTNDSFVITQSSASGNKDVCKRSPCDVDVPSGQPVTLTASKPGAAGSITLTPESDSDVTIPIQPAGLPPRPPQGI